MANTPRRRATGIGPPPSSRFSPFKEMGASGVAVFGGRVLTREKGPLVWGPQRWITYHEMVSNTSIVAAGVRYFLNIVAAAKWTVTPADDSAEAKKHAELIDKAINGMVTPWRRVARRSSSYRFMGFGIQEWTAKRMEDGTIGLEDIESRPQHTIDRWEVDDRGSVLGAYQRSPQTQQEIYLPRRKLLYIVEDSLTDSPEGLGLYRHLVEPYERLKKYMLLEGQGFERDLRGIPIGRVPYQALKASVKAGTMTQDDASKITKAIEDFVQTQTKKEDTSIVIDSAPYVVETESGKSVSGVMQYGLELLQGAGADFASIANAIERLNREMARIIGAEHLLLGGEGGANRALAEDKSRNFYQVVNGTLDDISDNANSDVIAVICDMNGISEEMRPKLTHSDISFRSVQEVTAALRDMATAGAVLQPNDPAIDDVRDMLGIQKAPEMTPEMMGVLNPGLTNQEEGDGPDVEGALAAGGSDPFKRKPRKDKKPKPNGSGKKDPTMKEDEADA